MSLTLILRKLFWTTFLDLFWPISSNYCLWIFLLDRHSQLFSRQSKNVGKKSSFPHLKHWVLGPTNVFRKVLIITQVFTFSVSLSFPEVFLWSIQQLGLLLFVKNIRLGSKVPNTLQLEYLTYGMERMG